MDIKLYRWCVYYYIIVPPADSWDCIVLSIRYPYDRMTAVTSSAVWE